MQCRQFAKKKLKKTYLSLCYFLRRGEFAQARYVPCPRRMGTSHSIGVTPPQGVPQSRSHENGSQASTPMAARRDLEVPGVGGCTRGSGATPHSALCLREVEYCGAIHRDTTNSIFEFCREAERKRGTQRRQYWWEQPMDLDAAEGVREHEEFAPSVLPRRIDRTGVSLLTEGKNQWVFVGGISMCNFSNAAGGFAWTRLRLAHFNLSKARA